MIKLPVASAIVAQYPRIKVKLAEKLRPFTLSGDSAPFDPGLYKQTTNRGYPPPAKNFMVRTSIPMRQYSLDSKIFRNASIAATASTLEASTAILMFSGLLAPCLSDRIAFSTFSRSLFTA